MRILQVRFKNLNSLAGEWEIDLTHPAFTSDGIFAITGPTGAGKTTILDAICLALYGRTPRLNKVTKSTNEIMSRQTGECFAEVTFETQTGRFRCHWSQRRAHKKSSGELQVSKHEIANADSGQIFETKMIAVAEQIVAATGMDFDRFTRSMLLAQGGFAAFLQAAADDRAPILEQITGTEIYSQISIRVHEIRSGERKKLDMLSAEMAGIHLLDETDERQRIKDLEQMNLQDAELNRQITEINNALVWLAGIAGLEQDLIDITGQTKDWQTRQAEFAPELIRLQRANQALELTGEYAGLVSIRREQVTDRGNLGECLQLLPDQEDAVKQAEQTMRQAAVQLDIKKHEQKEASQVIRKTRELDLKLLEKDSPIKTVTDAINGQETSLNTLRGQQDENCVSLIDKQKTREALLTRLAETAIDEGLVEHLAGIRGRAEVLKTNHMQLSGKLGEVTNLVSQEAEVSGVWAGLLASFEKRKGDVAISEKALAQKQLGLNQLLESRELIDWRNDLFGFKDKKLLLNQVGEAVKAFTEAKRALDGLNSRYDQLVTEQTDVTRELQYHVEIQAALEREISLLETQLSLLKKIQGFEEARHELQDDQPCPLCGATEHPFAEGNIPVPDETMAALNQARTDLKKLNGIVSNTRVKQAEVAKDLEQIIALTLECKGKMASADSQIILGCADLTIDQVDQNLTQLLPRLQDENEAQLANAMIIVSAADALEKEISDLRQAFEQDRELAVLAERETQSAAHRMDSVAQALKQARKDAGILDTQVQNALTELQNEVAVYDVTPLSIAVLDEVLLVLKARRDQWLARQNEKAELDRQISALEIQISHQTDLIRKSEDDLNKQRKQLAGLRQEWALINQERVELFGVKNPDDEEMALSSAIETAEHDLDVSRQVFNAASQSLETLKSRIVMLEKTVEARSGQLNAAEMAFLARLTGLGFNEEAEFMSACLSEEVRMKLTQQAQALANEQTQLASKCLDKTALLESERQKQLTDQTRETLDSELDRLVITHKDLQQQIGANRQKLKDNELLKERQKERMLAIDGQKRACAQWDSLHELIGSGDGKKYRNFAQGLTFEMMIVHANRQLQKMTDRYLLIRDSAQPLELNIIDNYQAGEVRSTKNLSGGESFIISLSLALGLSHMASKNVRVDSLFLDEGFGTLDEDALETALETLAGLQQGGKMIGIISHVSALKERIRTQIHITPQSGGRSLIDGPGCKKLA
ncbi:MAG: AAA family ATPase [Methylicorpusculum sp.]|uniref:AAA family ATPase n=1 Tax=Methylicorpusculum sp. TaxID=2713644 RepID=UPI00271A09F9|nr:AAA family ATPase [Methylicorpusculum sp.]MDO8940603.1 AAA family ATPase [Methylicorpusculum sp.]MDP2200542.1 AAA family ATPase [Methylicorpusculum sp.]